jgi:hypothetical protein
MTQKTQNHQDLLEQYPDVSVPSVSSAFHYISVPWHQRSMASAFHGISVPRRERSMA